MVFWWTITSRLAEGLLRLQDLLSPRTVSLVLVVKAVVHLVLNVNSARAYRGEVQDTFCYLPENTENMERIAFPVFMGFCLDCRSNFPGISVGSVIV